MKATIALDASNRIVLSKELRRAAGIPRRQKLLVSATPGRIVCVAEQLGTKLPAAPDAKALADFLDHQRQADPDHFPDLSLTIIKLLGKGEYIVEAPGREQEGHFGLAVADYTHSTAPNRRYADLLVQRLLKASMDGGKPPYATGELASLAAHCTEREGEAKKVERLMRKVAACALLRRRIGEVFDGIITGASAKGTYVRLGKLLVEGMVVRGQQGLQVGDQVRVQLVFVDMDRGYIDFAKAG